MDNREFLELAALATGRTAADGWEYFDYYANAVRMRCVRDGKIVATWQPNTDDGDCARMERQLRIDLEWDWVSIRAVARCGDYRASAREEYEAHNGDKDKARRLASTRVAAEIGKRIREAQG